MEKPISTSEAAKLLGISQRRVQAMIAAGQLPERTVGKVYFLFPSDLKKVASRKPGRPKKT